MQTSHTPREALEVTRETPYQSIENHRISYAYATPLTIDTPFDRLFDRRLFLE
jgi:hypothetical protein